MTRTTYHDDDHLGDEIAQEITDIEAHADDPLPPGTKITRGHARSRVLQVRLNEDELHRINELAEEREIPASTFARSILLRELDRSRDQEQRSTTASGAHIDRLERIKQAATLLGLEPARDRETAVANLAERLVGALSSDSSGPFQVLVLAALRLEEEQEEAQALVSGRHVGHRKTRMRST